MVEEGRGGGEKKRKDWLSKIGLERRRGGENGGRMRGPTEKWSGGRRGRREGRGRGADQNVD